MGQKQEKGWQDASASFPTRMLFCPECKRNRRFQQAAKTKHECLHCGLILNLEKNLQPRLACCVCGGTAHFKLNDRAACIDHKDALQMSARDLAAFLASYGEVVRG
jgi:hypothetical protein